MGYHRLNLSVISSQLRSHLDTSHADCLSCNFMQDTQISTSMINGLSQWKSSIRPLDGKVCDTAASKLSRELVQGRRERPPRMCLQHFQHRILMVFFQSLCTSKTFHRTPVWSPRPRREEDALTHEPYARFWSCVRSGNRSSG
jgi:hypothetical protein